MTTFHKQLFSTYGPEALVFGASEGIGLSFARELAEAGFNLFLVARRVETLDNAAEKIRHQFKVEVQTLTVDLSETGVWKRVQQSLKAKDFGLVIYNAAASPIGPFLDQELEVLSRTVSVNISTPMEILHGAGTVLRKRYEEHKQRGGVILMSSLSGLKGTPHIAAYAASKAWNTILAEGVGQETEEVGLDLMACIAGATDTPGYRDSITTNGTGAPIQSPDAVAHEALRSLGRRNVVITGRANKIIAGLVYGLIPGQWSSKILKKATSVLRRRNDAGLPYSISKSNRKS